MPPGTLLSPSEEVDDDDEEEDVVDTVVVLLGDAEPLEPQECVGAQGHGVFEDVIVELEMECSVEMVDLDVDVSADTEVALLVGPSHVHDFVVDTGFCVVELILSVELLELVELVDAGKGTPDTSLWKTLLIVFRRGYFSP